MRVSDICFGKLKEFEGLRTEAYYDAAGVLTIGYGHTGHDVRPGDVISKYWAEHLLKADELTKNLHAENFHNNAKFDHSIPQYQS